MRERWSVSLQPQKLQVVLLPLVLGEYLAQTWKLSMGQVLLLQAPRAIGGSAGLVSGAAVPYVVRHTVHRAIVVPSQALQPERFGRVNPHLQRLLEQLAPHEHFQADAVAAVGFSVPPPVATLGLAVVVPSFGFAIVESAGLGFEEVGASVVGFASLLGGAITSTESGS